MAAAAAARQLELGSRPARGSQEARDRRGGGRWGRQRTRAGAARRGLRAGRRAGGGCSGSRGNPDETVIDSEQHGSQRDAEEVGADRGQTQPAAPRALAQPGATRALAAAAAATATLAAARAARCRERRRRPRRGEDPGNLPFHPGWTAGQLLHRGCVFRDWALAPLRDIA